jgi:hypothetical protein
METKMKTQHAVQRAQQRGVPPLIQNWLLDYGKETYDGRGYIVRYFTNDCIRKMEKDFGRDPIRKLSEFLKCYLVETSDGLIITVGKRYNRINN